MPNYLKNSLKRHVNRRMNLRTCSQSFQQQSDESEIGKLKA